MDKEGNILNLVFVWAEDGTKLKVDVPIVYKGEDVCPGLKKGWSSNLIPFCDLISMYRSYEYTLSVMSLMNYASIFIW